MILGGDIVDAGIRHLHPDDASSACQPLLHDFEDCALESFDVLDVIVRCGESFANMPVQLSEDSSVFHFFEKAINRLGQVDASDFIYIETKAVKSFSICFGSSAGMSTDPPSLGW